MNKNSTAGAKANKTGNRLEKFVADLLEDSNYTFFNKKKFEYKKKFELATYIEQPIYSTQYYIGKNIYDTNTFCDFIVYHPQKHPECLIIETKWQQSSGSVDEKYPFLIMNIQNKYPHKTILVLDGGGYKKGAEQWVRDQVGDNLLAVYNMAEFQKWVNNGGL